MARRAPQTRFPHKIEQNYSRNLVRLFSSAGKRVLNVFDSQVGPLLDNYFDKYRADEDELDMIAALLEGTIWVQLKIEIMDVAETIIEKNLRLLEQFNATNMKQQGRIIGVDPTANEAWLDSFMRASIKENVGYISTIQNELYSKMSTIIYQGAKQSLSIAEIRDQLVEQIGMSERRAEFIAVDQTGSIFGQLTAKRHQQMDVKKFIWRDSNDERVRKKHRDLDGKTFSYNDPPSEGLPGTPFRCRCISEPVFDDE